LDESSFEACASDPGGFDATESSASARSLALAPYAVCGLRVND